MTRIDLIKQATRSAGLLIKNASPTKGIVTKAGRLNFATAADLASEKEIITTVNKHFRTDKILSEETHDEIEDPLSIGHLWVIDPIDGTNNFYSKRNYSAVSVAYVEKGETLYAAAYNPFVEEFFFAEVGKGAYMNDEKLTVGKETALTKATVGIDNCYDPKGLRHEIETFLTLDPLPWILIRGSVVLALCDVASNRLDIYFHMFLKPWDNAAAFLILKEAGGITKNTKGDDINFMSGEVVAGNETLVNQFLEQIKL